MDGDTHTHPHPYTHIYIYINLSIHNMCRISCSIVLVTNIERSWVTLQLLELVFLRAFRYQALSLSSPHPNPKPETLNPKHLGKPRPVRFGLHSGFRLRLLHSDGSKDSHVVVRHSLLGRNGSILNPKP